jgi:hypothetical protein
MYLNTHWVGYKHAVEISHTKPTDVTRRTAGMDVFSKWQDTKLRRFIDLKKKKLFRLYFKYGTRSMLLNTHSYQNYPNSTTDFIGGAY